MMNSMCLPKIIFVGGCTGQHVETSLLAMSIGLYLLYISKQMLTMSCHSSSQSLLNCCHTHPQSLFGYSHSCAFLWCFLDLFCTCPSDSPLVLPFRYSYVSLFLCLHMSLIFLFPVNTILFRPSVYWHSSILSSCFLVLVSTFVSLFPNVLCTFSCSVPM